MSDVSSGARCSNSALTSQLCRAEEQVVSVTPVAEYMLKKCASENIDIDLRESVHECACDVCGYRLVCLNFDATYKIILRTTHSS